MCRLLRNLKIDLPYYPSLPLVGVSQKEMKLAYEKVICTLEFQVIIAKIGSEPRYVPTDD